MATAVADALIAFGGNVGDVRETFNRALDMLCDGRDIRLVVRSSSYLTPPWGGIEDQPPFVNACAAIQTGLSPQALLARTQAVEAAFGRDRAREQHWGPRTLDIDLLAYDDIAIDEPDLTLPHPRLFERAFVLVPLNDIAADRRIRGVRVRDALARVDATGIERLPRR
jgi:2-amino-4-hydroxy-6-hydroxymethyldihydropteridine diphosphokinase